MIPQKLILHKKSRTLEVIYAGNNFILPAAYLRVKSTSAENKDKPAEYNPNVAIDEVRSIGNYAVQIYFNDGHKTGIYSWDYIRAICISMNTELARKEMQQKKQPTQQDTQVLNIQPAPKKN